MGSVRWNPYAYAGSNPTTFTDPSGEFFPLLGLIGAGLGALFGGGFDLDWCWDRYSIEQKYSWWFGKIIG